MRARDSTRGAVVPQGRWRRWLAVAGTVGVVAAVVLVLEPWRAGPAVPASLPAPVPAVVVPLHVEWGGCADVRLRDDVPVCVVDPKRALRLWIEGPPPDRLEVVVDGVTTPTEPYAVHGERGHGLRVWVPTGATELAVRVAGSPAAEAAWSLPLAPAAVDAPVEGVAEVGRALGRGDAKAARAAAERAHDRALRDGRLKDAVDVVLGTVGLMNQRRLDPEAVEGLLLHLEDSARRYPQGRGELASYRGVHLWYQGAIQEAAESLRDATRHALWLDDEVLAADSIPMYAEALAQLGYFDDARRWANEGLRWLTALDPCARGSVLRTIGWVSLGLRQRGRPHDDPAAFLERALEIFGEGGSCPRPAKLGGARLSLALLALDDGRLEDAAARLEQIERHRITLDERLHVDDLEMRLLLAGPQQRPEPRRAAYRRLQQSAEAVDTAEARWRLHTRRGRMLELEGDDAGAIEAYRAAELELDVLVRLQAAGIGRGERAARYHESTERLVSRLVARGDVAAAWCLVREDQARRRTATVAPTELDGRRRTETEEAVRRYRREKLVAEELEAKAQALPRDEAQPVLDAAVEAHGRARELAHALAKALGRLAPHPRCTELSSPAAGELLLGLYPREHDWLVFASDARETTAHAVPPPRLDGSREALATALLSPLAPRLDAARRVRVLAHGPAQSIDVHRLPWRGEPVGARVPVSYGVELAMRPGAPDPGRRALLVADPTHTLEGAEAEVELVSAALATAGWSTSVVGVLEPGAVSLAGYDLFHYAGHAESSARPDRGGWPPYPGGEAGWAAFLELGRAGRLTVHDVTTTSAVPRAVVLAGCRTGALELDTGQTSLALAFLVAGSEQVVASAEAVEDARGARFAQALYAAVVREPGAALDLALAMQRAQRELWAEGEEPPGYRVWVR